jgi:hypothetical protein
MTIPENQQDELGGMAQDQAYTGSQERWLKGWRRAGRLALRVAFIVVGLLLVLSVGQLLMSSFSLQDLASFRDRLERADSVLVFFRLGFITLLIFYWKPFNTWLAKLNGWSGAQLERVFAGRWWALSVLLFVEIILIQRVHEYLF